MLNCLKDITNVNTHARLFIIIIMTQMIQSHYDNQLLMMILTPNVYLI